MDWAAMGRTYAAQALTIILDDPNVIADNIIWDHYLGLMDDATPDDPERTLGWYAVRSVAYKEYEAAIRASRIPNTLFPLTKPEVWTVELALAGMRSELTESYDFVDGVKFAHADMVDMIMKTVTNYLKLVPELDGKVIDDTTKIKA